MITQQNHKVHKDGLFEQKLAKFTDPDMALEIGINSGFGGDFSCITQLVAPPSFAYFANFCSKACLCIPAAPKELGQQPL
jgi:hypothetical protein